MSSLFELQEKWGRLGFLVEGPGVEEEVSLRVTDDPRAEGEATPVKTWRLSQEELEELKVCARVYNFDTPPVPTAPDRRGTWLSCLNCRNHVFPDWSLMPVGAVMTDTVRKPWQRRRVFFEGGRLGYMEYSLTVWTDVRVVGGYISLHGCAAYPPVSWEATKAGYRIYTLPRCCTNAVALLVERGVLIPLRGRPFFWDHRAGISVARFFVEYQAMMERAEYCDKFSARKGTKMDQPWRKKLFKRRAELKAFGRPVSRKTPASGRGGGGR